MATLREGERGRKRRVRARRVRVGAPDARLTGCAGVEAVRELDRVLGITARWTRAWERSRSVAGACLGVA